MSPIVREYYRVPREDRGVYIRPPPRELPALVERNRRLLASWSFEFAGRPLGEFRAGARAEVMALARSYAGQWMFGIDGDWSEPAPIIVTGHQPTLIHPGVWIKNFLAGSLAAVTGGVALNLAVDNDEARGQVYRFPVRGGRSQGHEWQAQGMLVEDANWPARDVPIDEAAVIEIPFAHAVAGIAFEEQPVVTAPKGKPNRGGGMEGTAGFVGMPVGPDAKDVKEWVSRPMHWMTGDHAEAVGEELRKGGLQSMQILLSLPRGPIGEHFVHFDALPAGAMYQADFLGEVLVAGRRWAEERLGLKNLELPVSRLADGEAFRVFVAEMLRRHEELFAAHNESLAEYRRVYRERSAAQPVPDLAREGARIEMPFWVWRAGEARRRLWVEPADETRAPLATASLRQAGRPNGLMLFAETEEIGMIDVRARRGSGGRPADVEQLAALRQAGWKIRPRALTLTLFARLAVGDVFIHGLGGALYDKITDGIFERLFGVRPPEIVLASCTVRLPVEAYPSTPRDLEAARRRVRDWRFNPDRLLSGADRSRAEAAALIDEKWRLIREREATRDGRSRAWRRIRAINESLASLAPDGSRAAAEDLARVERELEWNAILQNREYPICFYPAEELAQFYRDVTSM